MPQERGVTEEEIVKEPFLGFEFQKLGPEKWTNSEHFLEERKKKKEHKDKNLALGLEGGRRRESRGSHPSLETWDP